MMLEDVRHSLTEVAAAAVDKAARGHVSDRAVDTRDVVVALMTLDQSAEWDRIWLEFAVPEALVVAAVADPQPDSGEVWLGRPVTGTCAAAIRAALVLADGSDLLPVSAGVLMLCMVGQPHTAASRALLGPDRSRYPLLLSLVQEAVLGGGWEDIERVLDHVFSLARPGSSDAGPSRSSDPPLVGREKKIALKRLLAELEELDEATDHEQVIAVCEAIGALVSRQENPAEWAAMKLMVAGALVRNPAHDPADDIRRAIGCCEAAREVFEQRSMPHQWAAVLDLMGTAYCQWAVGNHDDNVETAIGHYQNALIVESVLPADFLAVVHNNLGAAYLDRMRGSQADNVETAIKHLTTALAAYEVAGVQHEPALQSEWTRAQDNLGRACAARQQDDPASNVRTALSHFEQALTVRRREILPSDFAVTTANVAAVLADRSEDRAEGIEEAIRLLEDAMLALQECAPELWPPNWGLLVQRLSGTYAERLIGDPAENAQHAIEFLEFGQLRFFAMAAHPELPDHRRVDEAHLLVALGRAYVSPGLRNTREYGDHLERGIQYLIQAMTLYDRDSVPLHWARGQNSLGIAYADRVAGDRSSNLRRAIECFEDTLAIYIPEAFPLDRAATLHNLGAAYADLASAVAEPSERARNLSRSIGCYADALEVIRAHGDTARCLTTGWELGKVCADAGQWAEASRAYLDAIGMAEDFYAASLLQDAKEAQLAHVFGLHQDAAYALARSGELKNAARILEQGRSRALSESLARDRADLGDLGRDDPALAAAYRSAAGRVGGLERLQRQLSNQANHPLADMRATFPTVRRTTAPGMREAVHAARDELATIVRQIQTRFPQLLAKPDWAEICQAVTPEQPAAYAAVTHHGGLVLLLHATSDSAAPPGPEQGISVQVLFTGDDRGQLLRDIDGLLVTFDDDDQVIGGYLPGQRRKKATWLADSLTQMLPLLGERMIAPLAEQLRASGATGVTFLAGPPLGLLPLHAARWQKNGQRQWLLNDFDVSYAPAARVLGMARAALRERSAHVPTLTALADPPQDDLPALPFARAEVSAAAEFFGPGRSDVLDPKHATRDAVIRAGAEAAYVHLACHGEFNADDPPRSRFFLAEGTELTMGDIMSGQPFPQARLVVMSACQTAVTDIRRLPDEAVGFPAGILQSGVPGVIGTLWPVDDLACALLMTRFYQYHLRGCPDRGPDPLSPPAALSQAQRWLGQATSREVLSYCEDNPTLDSVLSQNARRARLSKKEPTARPFGHPLFWAPFVYVGA